MDWSLDETRGFLVISMQEYWNIGEGRVFDGKIYKKFLKIFQPTAGR